MDHIGSAHDEAEVEALKAVAYQRLAHGQKNSTSVWKAEKAVTGEDPGQAQPVRHPHPRGQGRQPDREDHVAALCDVAHSSQRALPGEDRLSVRTRRHADLTGRLANSGGPTNNQTY